MSEARLFSERTLLQWSRAEIEEPVVAVVIELVANAVRHAVTDLELRLLTDGRVRVEVHDHDPTPPVRRRPGPMQEGGRGMMIVEAYASRWGIRPTDDGKTVWAEIDLP